MIFLYSSTNKMFFIPLAKRKERLARKKVERHMTYFHKILPSGLMTKVGKRNAEGQALDDTPPKIQKQGGSSSQVPKDNPIETPKEDKAGKHSFPAKDDSPINPLCRVTHHLILSSSFEVVSPSLETTRSSTVCRPSSYQTWQRITY